MTQVVFVPPSNGSVPQIVTQSPLDDPSSVFPGFGTSGVDPNQSVTTPTWEATTLKPLVEEIFRTDPRFVGLSRFIVNVRIFWSFEIPTACAGHGFIFFNPNWWDELPDETCKTVLVHEVWHLILKHLERGEGLDPSTHNQSADHVINLNLDKEGFTFEGWNCLKDPNYIGLSTEQIYNIIWEEREKNPPLPQPGPSKDQIEQLIKDQLIADAAAGGKNKTLRQQKEEADANADEAQKSLGSTPGNNNIKLELTKNKIQIQQATYQKIFNEYLIDPLSGGKRTFMRPSRRSHGQATATLLTPGRFPKRGHKNRLTHLVYALDVSGSISKPMRQQFHDSVRTIKDLLNPEKLTVLLFDTRIVFEKTFTDREKYGNIDIHAGGGTDLKDVYARMTVLDAEAMVCFTDLDVGIPPQPKWKSIWIVPHMGCTIPRSLYGDVYLMPTLK